MAGLAHRFAAAFAPGALLALALACPLAGGCRRTHEENAALGDLAAIRAAMPPRPALRPIAPGIPLDLHGVDSRGVDSHGVDLDGDAFLRFRRWVDLAAAGTPDYGFSAYDAALLHRYTHAPVYCDLAIRTTEDEVAQAERAIAAGRAPAVADDSYLDVGPRIAALAMTLDSCRTRIPPAQRARWSAFAEQAVWNVWHPLRAHWGAVPHPWSGWSTDNPGDNYYYSFVEATLYWALASGSNAWMRYLNEEALPPLIAYFSMLPGGGSLEGTGYGASHMRLFALYRLWRDATGEDIANLSPHARNSIDYWVHATVPTLDRFAPIGDQSRSSIPELYDYHRRLMLEARSLTRDPHARALSSWWLHHIAIDRMRSGFNARFDLLPAGEDTASPPTDLFYLARGTGHLFARDRWRPDAMWLAFVAGPYTESHAHQEQGGFALFAHDWLTVSENVWTHSGIQQGSETHNVLRFERDAPLSGQCQAPADDRIVHQCPGTRATLTVADHGGGALTAVADLAPVYGPDSPVRQWTRRLDFAGRALRVEDRFATAPDTRAVFQLQVPVEPRIEGTTAIAGRLRVRVLSPAGAHLDAYDWRTQDRDEFRSGWRLDITGGRDGYVVVLDEAP